MQLCLKYITKLSIHILHFMLTWYTLLLYFQCSATCGFGTHERYVSCRDYNGKVADDSYCAGRPKPPYVEKCKVQSCGEWRTGAWTPVSLQRIQYCCSKIFSIFNNLNESIILRNIKVHEIS